LDSLSLPDVVRVLHKDALYPRHRGAQRCRHENNPPWVTRIEKTGLLNFHKVSDTP